MMHLLNLIRTIIYVSNRQHLDLPIKIHTVCEELESSWTTPDKNADGGGNTRDGHIDQNRPSNLSVIGPCGAHEGGNNCKCGRT